MEEITTHGEMLLVALANQELSLQILMEIAEAVLQEVAVLDPILKRRPDPVGVPDIGRIAEGLSLLAIELIDKLIEARTKKLAFITYAAQEKTDSLYWKDGRYIFGDIAFGFNRRAIPTWKISKVLSEIDIHDVLQVFSHLQNKIGPIDPERLGKCPICGRYFVSRRRGKRKSRACSKDHQAVLVARELRSSPAYREREKLRNTQRMSAVREAESLVSMWRNEGKTKSEVFHLLWDWNKKNGSILGKRSIHNMLEKKGG